jgi:membrane protein implicated in regulation of membrane protease activity
VDALTVTFLAIGGFAILILALSLVGGHTDLGHLHLGHLHLGHAGHAGHAGGHDGGGVELTLPAIAGFLGAFGFAGAIVAALSDRHSAGTALLAGLIGLGAAVPAGWAAGRLMSAAVNMNTDATLTSNDLLGATGVVIRSVPEGGYGEVRLSLAGQPLKFNARADQPLAVGTQIFVIEVPSPTSVLVEPTPGSLVDPSAKEGQ